MPDARALGQTGQGTARREAGDGILNTTAGILDMFRDGGIVYRSKRPNKMVEASRNGR